MKRKSIFLIVLMLTSVGAVVLQNAPVQAQTKEVVFWTGAQTSETLTKMIDDFNNNPNYNFKVNMQEGTFDTNSQFDSYVSRFQSQDNSFDVFAMDVIWPPSFIENNWLEPLNDILPAKNQSQFLDAPIKAASSGGNIYAVPWFHDSGLLYYRTDILQAAYNQGVISFNRAPQTWAELHDMSVNITKSTAMKNQFGSSLDGYVWQGKAYEGLMCDFMEILGGTGQTSWLTTNSSGTYANLDTQNVKDSLTYMNSLVKDGASPRSVLTFGEEEARGVWNDGNAVFMRNWPYAYALSLNTTSSNVVMSNGTKLFDVAPMPSRTANDPNARTSCLGGWELGLNAYSNVKPEAKQFISWLTAEKQQLTYFAGNGNLPTRKSAYDVQKLTDAGAGDQTYIVNFLPAFEKALPRPINSKYPEMSAELWDPINKAVAGDLAPAAAATQMQASVENILNATVSKTPFNPMWAFFGMLALGVAIREKRRRID